MAPRGPRYLQFFPTLRCNFSCAVCFNRELEIPSDMALDEYVRLVNVMSEHGIREIDIIGGEPTLHECIHQMLERNCRCGIRTTMSTNGSAPWLLEEISRFFKGSDVRIGISLYRENESSPELRRYIYAHRPILKSVATRGSFVPEFAASYLNIPGITYYLIYMDALSPADIETAGSFPDFYERLGHARRLSQKVEGVFCSGFIYSGDGYSGIPGVRCPAGTTKLSIKPNGDVYPCYLLFHDDAFRVGNILHDSFSKLWSSPVLSFFREPRSNPCSLTACRLHRRCRGGCPAVSLRVSGDMHTGDPRCVTMHSSMIGYYS